MTRKDEMRERRERYNEEVRDRKRVESDERYRAGRRSYYDWEGDYNREEDDE